MIEAGGAGVGEAKGKDPVTDSHFPAPHIFSDSDFRLPTSHFARDVLTGLSRSPKSLSCKYLYDTRGSRLFQRIMELPEYYLTRCEVEILSSYRWRLAEILQARPFHLIELGAGDGMKTRLLIDCFLERRTRFRYIPMDISREAMNGLMTELRAGYPSLQMEGLICEYSEGVKWLSRISRAGDRCNLVLFLGSTIGNLRHCEAMTFMRTLWESLNPGDYVLTGFDLKKEIPLMIRAYNDSRGVTAEFNMNLLRRINRELEGEFDPSRFEYYSTYNTHSSAVESFLISRERQEVHIGALGRSISFDAWEPLQTESSHKYLASDVEAMALETGFVPVEHILDSRGYFMDSLWQVP